MGILPWVWVDGLIPGNQSGQDFIALLVPQLYKKDIQRAGDA